MLITGILHGKPTSVPEDNIWAMVQEAKGLVRILYPKTADKPLTIWSTIDDYARDPVQWDDDLVDELSYILPKEAYETRNEQIMRNLGQ